MNQLGIVLGQLLLAQFVNTVPTPVPGGFGMKPQTTQGVPQTLSSLIQPAPATQITATPAYLVASS